MTNADEFLGTFASIERTLRSKTRSDRTASFYQLVDAAAGWSPEIRRYRDDLKEFADLRNAIIHERSDGHVIAEPNDRALERLRVLEGMVLRPPAVVPMFQGEVFSVSVRDFARAGGDGDGGERVLAGARARRQCVRRAPHLRRGRPLARRPGSG